MLLEFSVENDRAFAGEARLSLIPSRLKDVEEGHVLSIGGESKLKALSTAVILGKNGGGKTTLVSSFAYLGKLVSESANESRIDQPLGYTPNVLIAGNADKPTAYRVVFSMHGVVYEFECSFDRTRILTEALRKADQSPKYRLLYEREFMEAGDYRYKFGEALTGPKSTWVEITRENSLFLSAAVHANSNDLRVPFEWLTNYIRVISAGDNAGNRRISSDACANDARAKERIVTFLQAFDINVVDIDIEEDPIDEEALSSTFSEHLIGILRAEIKKGNKRYKITFKKAGEENQTIDLDLTKESTGTQALFGLAGPVYETLRSGYCLIVDEINQSLHPSVVELLIRLFSDGEINRSRAQLIFTTHDTSILSHSNLRRDQIWFVENDGKSAELIPLSDYAPRKGEALDRGYLGGRYGGLPNVNISKLLNVWRTNGEK